MTEVDTRAASLTQSLHSLDLDKVTDSKALELAFQLAVLYAVLHDVLSRVADRVAQCADDASCETVNPTPSYGHDECKDPDPDEYCDTCVCWKITLLRKGKLN